MGASRLGVLIMSSRGVFFRGGSPVRRLLFPSLPDADSSGEVWVCRRIPLDFRASLRGQKNARPRVGRQCYCLLVLLVPSVLGVGAGPVVVLVPLRSRTGFALVWCLCYCNG